jgi:phosphoribosylformimino-5-aminoimidazole carboxamide ribotide isomerase
MIIFPAIDIKSGKCVRLKQGNALMSTTYFEDPVEAGSIWAGKGAKAIHVVDLDGAFSGNSQNFESISKIKETTGLFIEVGGGIRDKLTVEKLICSNIDRIILGTAALNDRDLVEWAVREYDDRIAVSIDSINNKVAYKGWTGISEVNDLDLIEQLISVGINTFIYTDISKDGMLSGPNIESIKRINTMFDINIIASGGVTTIEDVKELRKIGVYGAIIGKALYNGNIKLEEALEVSGCF